MGDGSGFMTGIVSIVDSNGKRIDTSNVNGDYAPVELQIGDNLTPTKSESGQLTRVRIDASGGGGDPPPSPPPPPVWNLVNTFSEPVSGSGLGHPSGNQTSGVIFYILPGNDMQITGVRFYWDSDGNETVRTKIYDVGTTSVLGSADIATHGHGIYVSEFSSPINVDDSVGKFLTKYIASVHDVAGGVYTKVTSNSGPIPETTPALPFFTGTRLMYLSFKKWVAGDAYPTSDATSEYYVVEPFIIDA